MSVTLTTGGNIANIERIGITTVEDTPRTFIFETATSASYTPKVSEGTEQSLRIKNTIHGRIKTEDLVDGNDIEIQDQKLLMGVMAIVDGGTYTATAGDVLESYSAPSAGSSVSRVAFNLDLYTSDRNTDGSAEAFHKWSFPNCKGKPVAGAFKDGDFATNTYKIESRPASGTPAMTLNRIAALPT